MRPIYQLAYRLKRSLVKLGHMRRKILTSYLLLYITIPLISLLLGIMLYNHTMKIMVDDIRNSNNALISRFMSLVDARVAEMDRISIELSENDKIKSFMLKNSPLDGSDYLQLKDINSVLSLYSSSNDFMKYMLLYFKKSDIIVSGYWGSDRMSSFKSRIYKKSNKGYTELDEGTASLDIEGKIVSEDTILTPDGSTRNMIVYLHPLVSTAAGSVNATLMLYIDKKEIEKMVADSTNWIAIFDKDDNIITGINTEGEEVFDKRKFTGSSGSFDQLINSKKSLVIYSISSYNGWKYATAIPYGSISEKVSYFKIITIAIVLVYLLLTTIVAYYMAYLNTRPVRSILEDFFNFNSKKKNSIGNEYDVLKSRLRGIIENNNLLMKTVEKQDDILEETFIDKLLKGDFNTQEELNAYKCNLNFKIDFDKFAVAVLKTSGYGNSINSAILKELSISKALAENIIAENINEDWVVYKPDVTSFAIIMGFYGQQNNSDIEHEEEIILDNILCKVREKFGIVLKCGIGGVYSQISDIFTSYNEALRTADYFIPEADCRIFRYTGLPPHIESINYYYPLEIEQKLKNVVEAGSSTEAEAILDRIWHENFTARTLVKKSKALLLSELCGTFHKICYDLISKNEISEDAHHNISEPIDQKISKDFDIAFSTIKEKLLEITEKVHNKRKDQSGYIMGKVIAFIEENYKDQELTLTKVAEKFSFNDIYLSQCMKRHTGKTFTAYLETLRIDRANELLSNKNLTVNEIAERVGYTNVITFRRAFKRVTGLIPSDIKRGLQ